MQQARLLAGRPTLPSRGAFLGPGSWPGVRDDLSAGAASEGLQRGREGEMEPLRDALSRVSQSRDCF